MKSLILALSMAVACAGLAPLSADAKRIGGGASSGMQRSMPARTPPAAAPAQPAQANPGVPAAAGAAAAAPRRSWMGPIAGLAAGLGIAALMSHLGMGAGFGNLLTMLLLGVLAFVAIRFLMQRFKPSAPSGSLAASNGMQFAGVTSNPSATGQTDPAWNRTRPVGAATSTAVSATPATGRVSLPAGFDGPGFERVAKMIFIRMQAANDSADLNDLRAFTTPEMFATIKLDLQDRGAATAQQTDVERIDAEVLDVATENQVQIVSVRFHGLIREERNSAAQPFDEIWHLVKPIDASRDWAIAGIQQSALA